MFVVMEFLRIVWNDLDWFKFGNVELFEVLFLDGELVEF